MIVDNLCERKREKCNKSVRVELYVFSAPCHLRTLGFDYLGNFAL